MVGGRPRSAEGARAAGAQLGASTGAQWRVAGRVVTYCSPPGTCAAREVTGQVCAPKLCGSRAPKYLETAVHAPPGSCEIPLAHTTRRNARSCCIGGLSYFRRGAHVHDGSPQRIRNVARREVGRRPHVRAQRKPEKFPPPAPCGIDV